METKYKHQRLINELYNKKGNEMEKKTFGKIFSDIYWFTTAVAAVFMFSCLAIGFISKFV